MSTVWTVLTLVLSICSLVKSRSWSSPHTYQGMPSYAYSEEGWPQYFEVVDSLPNVTWTSPRSFAGSISTETPDMPNNTLFFWGFETFNGSITSTNSSDPWVVYLAGGPGYSSMASALVENIGPNIMTPSGLARNEYSWHNFTDVFFVDSPVGTGYSTSGLGGAAGDEERVASDFLAFIENLTKVFPGLRTRPLYLLGESYAGRFIPYILKAYFGLDASRRSVQFRKAGCSSPALLDASVFENIPILQVVETYPQLIGYDTSFYDYIREQNHLCGYDLNLTYPQLGGKFPSVEVKYGSIGDRVQGLSRRDSNLIGGSNRNVPPKNFNSPWSKRAKSQSRRQSDSPSFNTTLTEKINDYYGCDIRDMVFEYTLNYTYPWSELKDASYFDITDVPYVESPRAGFVRPQHWMNDNTTRNAIHAPHNKFWDSYIRYEWGNPEGIDSSSPMNPRSIDFMDELMANATAENIGILWFSGNDDALSAHFSLEVAIQNTTWDGIQGFTRRPNTTWYDDNGIPSGIVHEERGLMYALVYGAGHQINTVHPERVFAFIRDFFVGDMYTGLVNATVKDTTTSNDPGALPDGVVPGQRKIYYGSKTVTWPEATITAFNNHILSTMLD
ncbi:Alpha/Beta hydrolase protein [Lentinula lateritia]|uniref:Carboxypeptidase n=1 Tax=Lentinula lateritia TaxID=40482 RepID=A0ABQ8VVZ3_9AGAR|nr:Alpha/Beta hydrolase protein [Lentinula lateritia]